MSGGRADTGRQTFKVLLTAQEAFPEFERLFLAAEHEIKLSFRIFDPWTRLQSPEAQAIGDTWMDLISHTLARGVRIDIVISDFDPVLRPDFHWRSWNALRALFAAGEISGRPDLLRARTSMHPARVGGLLRTALWPRSFFEIHKTAKRVSQSDDVDADRFLEQVPYLRRHLRRTANGLSARLWPIPSLAPATHHQKLAVFDRKLLYVGGLDLNDRRYDTPDHDRAAEQTWHDVQLLLSGSEVDDALAHIESFRRVTSGEPAPALSNLLRTISKRRRFAPHRMSPRTYLTELSDAHKRCGEEAQHLIYLETQYFRDRPYARHLARLAREKPELKLILIVPGAPDDVAFENATSSDARYGEYMQAKCVQIVQDAFGDRLFIGSPAQPCASGRQDRSQLYGAPLVYLHAKVSIFDNAQAIVASGNLNGRSMQVDTEAGVCLTDPAEVAQLKKRCFDHWLGDDADDRFFDLATALSAWKDRAHLNARTRPKQRKGFILHYCSGPARRFGRNIPGIPEEMV
ncbi:phospholipase D-like domain-containing protein [Arenibacterium sp. CAU 1754]